MGFTALDGLPMGTRPGQLDPGVVLYLIAEKGMSAAAVQDLFYKESGLKGLSGVSNDVRELEASADPKAAFALEYFVYRAGLFAGMLAAALQGVDAFVFTAGIGENSPTMRARISERLSWLGVALDQDANARLGASDIAEGQPRHGLRHTHQRRADDCAAHLGPDIGTGGEGRRIVPLHNCSTACTPSAERFELNFSPDLSKTFSIGVLSARTSAREFL